MVLDDYKGMFEADPDGFKLLREFEEPSLVSSHECPNGDRIVCVDKRKIHSGRDPRTEARRFVRLFPLDGKRFVLLMGFGSGYVAQAFHQANEIHVLVYEPSLAMLKEGLPHLPPDSRTQIFTSHRALELYFQANRILARDLKMVQWPASARIQNEDFQKTSDVVINCLNQSNLTYNTQNNRSQGWLKNYLTNLPQFIRHPNLTSYRDGLAGATAIICSAGPSLTENAHLLKTLKGKAVIIAVNTAARSLASLGIEADIVISVESLNITSQLTDIEWLPNCTAFLEATGTPAAFDLPFGSIVPISVHSDHASGFSNVLCPGQTFSAGFCVAHAAVVLAVRLGCTGIVLIGQDLAFKDGRAYAQGTVFEDIRVDKKNGRSLFRNVEAKTKIDQASTGITRSNPEINKGVISATAPSWGNPEASVDTSAVYKIFAKWFTDTSYALTNQGIWHINATEGGMHIENWEDLSFAETIERYSLDQAPSEPSQHVRARLDDLRRQPGLPPSHVIGTLEKEQEQMANILQKVIDLRSWVDNDPDGDIKSDPQTSEKIFDTWEELRAQISETHLLQAQLARSLTEMVDRQELNTFALSSVIETEIRQLSGVLESVVRKLKDDTAQSRAAS